MIESQAYRNYLAQAQQQAQSQFMAGLVGNAVAGLWGGINYGSSNIKNCDFCNHVRSGHSFRGCHSNNCPCLCDYKMYGVDKGLSFIEELRQEIQAWHGDILKV